MRAEIVLENIGVRFPSRILFEEVNWTLYEGTRVTLAGRNGSGKSTLLKIMAGQFEPTEGKVTLVGGKNLRLGFLDQSLLDSAVLEVAEEKDKSISPLNYLKTRMPHTSGDGREAHEVSDEEIEWEIRKILGGLGYTKDYMDNPMSQLSGGWLLRMFIASALLAKPHVLLLDEPTNHLDISSIQWLEEFLTSEFEGSLILITHDVSLQRRATDSLAVLHGGRFFFRTHQRDYLTFKESLGDEKRILEKNIEGVQGKIDENMEFYTKFRAKAQTAARAQSKLKAAEVLQEEMRLLKDKLSRIEGYNYNLRFRFRLSEPGSKFPMALKDVSFRYQAESPQILKNVNFDIKRGQKVAIIGDNGAGKTTLLNVIAGRLKPQIGEVMQGFGVTEGYFGQHQLDELSLEDSLLDNLRVRSSGIPGEQLRSWLGAFGFTGTDSVDKKVRVLSGGERARLALLRTVVTPINLCLLDEPTNHLDVETKELLKDAMKEYEGTVVFVSHDREFISAVADRIIYLSLDHQLTDHLGNLDSFFEKYPQFVRHLEGKAKASSPAVPAEKPAPKASDSLSYEERKKTKNLLRSLEKKVAQLEQDIDKLGQEKDALQAQISNDADAKRYADLENTLHAKMVDWERMGAELDALKKKYPDLK